MSDRSIQSGIGISVLIGVVIAGLCFLILLSMSEMGEKAMGPACMLYILLGTAVSFAAGWASVAISGPQAWKLKGALACPVIYLFTIGLIGTVINTDGADTYNPSLWIALLISVLFSILGAAGCNYIRAKQESNLVEETELNESRSE